MAAAQTETFFHLFASSTSLQVSFAILVVGLIVIATIYRKFWAWTRRKKFSYAQPTLAEFVRRVTLPLFAIALVSSINFYIQTFELFDESLPVLANDLTPDQTFAKMLNSMNILVVAFTIGHMIVIALEKYEKLNLEKQDFKAWQAMGGFKDDLDDLFHQCYRWIPPKNPPEEIDPKKFNELLDTKKGRDYLEKFIKNNGVRLGSYEKIVKDPFSIWKKSEQTKYEKYYNDCITGNNETGRKLFPGKIPDEIFEIDIWQEEKRFSNYESIIAGEKLPGYAEKKREGMPKPFRNYIPLAVFLVTLAAIVAWWGVDLIVLATASGGIAVGLGFALKETFENYFAYVMIRKDKIFTEGDRIGLTSGYEGFVHKLTTRVTYIRHPLNESIAIVPTKQLVSTEIVNFTKEFSLVPATVDVGASYLNDPKQVAAVLMKVGLRALEEIKDDKGNHLAVQSKCPYLKENRPSCGCDKQFVLDLEQPTVRFNKFNDSSLDFSLWVFVKDYGSQFKAKSEMRMMIYEEFKKYDIRIPWPIRTIYQGDEKKETNEIAEFEAQRKDLLDKLGQGSSMKGGSSDD